MKLKDKETANSVDLAIDIFMNRWQMDMHEDRIGHTSDQCRKLRIDIRLV